MEWNPREVFDRRVRDYCILCRPRDIELEFPDRPGVYVFLDLDLHPTFVGASGPEGLREAALAARDEADRMAGAFFAKWLATASVHEARTLAEDLLARYQPPPS